MNLILKDTKNTLFYMAKAAEYLQAGKIKPAHTALGIALYCLFDLQEDKAILDKGDVDYKKNYSDALKIAKEEIKQAKKEA